MAPTIGDGNCLFRSLARILYGSEDFHTQVRLLLVQFEDSNASKLQPLVFPANNSTKQKDIKAAFDNHMKLLRVWGTQIELQTAASLFQMPLYVCMHKVGDALPH